MNTFNDKPTDWLDMASEQTAKDTQLSLSAIRKAASKIPEGKPGECQRCGEFSLRLVNKNCARCRDKFKLP